MTRPEPRDRRAQSGRAQRAAAAALLLLAGLCAGCARRSPEARNLLLITIDTLRSDRLGAYGNARVLTPAIDALARRGVLFADANMAIPATLPSHASILTGRYPTGHRVHDNGVYELAAGESTLAEILAGTGFDTGGFVGSFVLDRRFGIAQGFSAFGDKMEEPIRRGAAPSAENNPLASWWVGTWFGAYQRRGESVVAEALGWLAARRGAPAPERPFFVWVHLFDPHEPYTPPEPLQNLYDAGYSGSMDGSGEAFAAARAAGGVSERDVERMRALYDAEVTYTDRCVGTLLDSLGAWGLLDETVVALVADHGEGLGEHDYYFEHASRLWEPLLRVPLILAGPGLPHGRVISGRVRTVDILPTVVEMLGVPSPAGLDGVSLRERIAGEPGERAAYAETQCGLQALPVEASLRAWSSGRWKLLVEASRLPADAAAPPRISLFDLEQDPGETANRSAERGRVAEDLLRRLAEVVRAAGADTGSVNTRAMDEETVAKLRALGYVQ